MRSTPIHATVLVLSAMLSAVAPAQLPQWRLVEELRIGSDASPMTSFTQIHGIIEGSEGKIFVLDSRPQEIRVFDRAGKFVTLAARRGQGPGEIRSANGMLLVKDAVWVNDPGNGRWSAYSAVDGKHMRQIPMPVTGVAFIWEVATDAEGRIVEPISVETGRMNPATNSPIRESKVRRVRTDGSGAADTVAAAECHQRTRPARTRFSGTPANSPYATYVGIPFQALPITAFDGRGGYWCTPNDEYVIVHRSLAKNDTLHTVRLAYTRLRVTDEERTRAIEDVKTSLARYPVVDADYSLVPTVHPVFVRLDVDDGGRVWARRVVAKDSPLTFDVYDQNGRAVATVRTTIPFARGIHVKGDNVYGVVRDADDVQYVVRARIVR